MARRLISFAGALVVVASCRTAAPPRLSHSPDPVLPPIVGSRLLPAEENAARAAVSAAERGDFPSALTTLRTLPAGHPVTRLVELEISFLRGGQIKNEAYAFAREQQTYASAWGLVALAARKEGDLKLVIESARKADGLQSGMEWAAIADSSEKTLLNNLLEDGLGKLQRGDGQGARDRAKEALEIKPELTEARFLALKASLALGDSRAAAELVPALPDNPEGLELKGQVAERLDQWDLAVEFYGRLPNSNPRKCELLQAAKNQLRLANAPPYLAKALASPALNRRGFAAIIVWAAPEIVNGASGPVPVFEDVVKVQERNDVITVARTGVMPGDPVARRFGAENMVSKRELTQVLDRLSQVLGQPAPHWCSGEAATEECLRLPEMVDGKSVAALVNRVAGDGEKPCRKQ